MNYDFFKKVRDIHNSGQTHSLILCGNVYDLFFDGESYVPLIPYLLSKTKSDNIIRIVYELNGPIRILNGQAKLEAAYAEWRSKLEPDAPDFTVNPAKAVLAAAKRATATNHADDLKNKLNEAIGKPAAALEFLRQLTICSRQHLKGTNLFIIIEAADMSLPSGNGDISALNDAQLRRISIMQDWFQDPEFIHGGDTVCLVAESASLIHPRVSRLPQVISVEVPSPNKDHREHFIGYFSALSKKSPPLENLSHLGPMTAGLSLYAIQQLLAGAFHAGEGISSDAVIAKVEDYIQSQVGEDVVEFKKPAHRLKDCKGNTNLIKFLERELIPRFQADPELCLPGAAVAGPIGGGKTFIFEAVASELNMPVLVLKNVRSQWYGQTDVIFERLRRVLEALEKVCIFCDEADTQFGSVSGETHSTERRLTGKIQQMMSDPKLRGKVIWLLMTARIHLLSPDIRRPGRVGDLIIPVLDPEGEDRKNFLKWVLSAANEGLNDEQIQTIADLTSDYSAAAFASLRSYLKSQRKLVGGDLPIEEIQRIAKDQIPPDIGKAREYQKLQALVNCTRRSLLPDPNISDEVLKNTREAWLGQIKKLESEGIS